MNIFDDELPPRKEAGAPSNQPRTFTPQAQNIPAPSSRPSFLQQTAEHAWPIAGPMLAMALAHKVLPQAEARVPAVASGIEGLRGSPLGRMMKAGEHMFSPTATNDRGIDFSPLSPPTKPGGPNIAGGLKAYPERAAPILERALNSAKETEAVLRETGGKYARVEDWQTRRGRQNWQWTQGFGPTELRGFLQHVEKSRKPGDRGFIDISPEAKSAAGDMRAVFKDAQGKLNQYFEMKSASRAPKTVDAESGKRDWQENYFPRQWNETINPSFFLGKRKFPTFEEALEAGYTPKWNDPITFMNHYVSNVNQFLQKQEALAILEQRGWLRGYGGKYRPPQGWDKVQGYSVGAFGQDAYAPGPMARVINNRYSKGFSPDSPNQYMKTIGEAIDPIQHGFNMIKGGAFFGGGYHLVTTAMQGIASDMQRALRLTAEGDPVKGLKTALLSPTAPVMRFRDGQRLAKEWLGTSPGASEIAAPWDYSRPLSTRGTSKAKTIADLYEGGGGRAFPYEQAKDYHYSSGGSYFQRATPFNAAGRAALRMQYELEGQHFKQRFQDGKYWEVTKNIFGQVGRVMDTVAQPVFQKYVPAMKNGAFYARMGDWMDTHPLATQGEALRASREIIDSVDNRFGEMVQDNIFWQKTAKQLTQLLTVSYSYELGTLREIGGGLKDVTEGKFSTERAAYLLALPVAYGYLSSIYMFLKTGKGPESWLDLVAPQTGGFDPRTRKPERVYPMGDEKDFVHLFQDPYAMITNKLAPGPASAIEFIQNSDWRGDPVHPPNPSFAELIRSYMTHVGNAMIPIPLKTQYGPKTGFSVVERTLGVRPAGVNLTDPARAEAYRKRKEQERWHKKQTHDRRDEHYYGEKYSPGGVD